MYSFYCLRHGFQRYIVTVNSTFQPLNDDENSSMGVLLMFSPFFDLTILSLEEKPNNYGHKRYNDCI